jgi:uncharacterized membrane protein (DUF2068 family)
MPRAQHRHNRFIALIACFRLAKSLLLIAAGIGALELVRPDVSSRLARWIDHLPLAAGHDAVMAMAEKMISASPSRKELAAIAAFAYAALFAVEGVGLWLERVWAEYLTIIATTSFIPFEVYEVMKRATALRIAVLIANIAIVGYLVYVRVSSHRGTA